MCACMHVYVCVERESLCTVCHVCTWKRTKRCSSCPTSHFHNHWPFPPTLLCSRPDGAGGSGALDQSTSASCLPVAGDEQPGRRPDSLPSAFFMWIMTLQLMEMSSIRLSDSHSSGDQKPRLVGWTKWQRNWDESRREEPGKCLDGSLKSECFRVQRQSRLAVDQRCNHLLKVPLVTALRQGQPTDCQRDRCTGLKGGWWDRCAEKGKGFSSQE